MTDFLVLEDAIAAGPSGPITFQAGRLISDDVFDVTQLGLQGVALLQFDPVTMGPARDAFLKARGAQARPLAINGDLSSLLISSGVIRPIPPGAVLSFGNTSITSTTTTRFLEPWFVDGTAPTSLMELLLSREGRIRNFFVRHADAAGNGASVVYTLLLNGVPTAMTVTLPTGVASTVGDTTTVVTVAQTDRLGVEVTKAAGIGSTPGPILCSMEFI